MESGCTPHNLPTKSEWSSGKSKSPASKHVGLTGTKVSGWLGSKCNLSQEDIEHDKEETWLVRMKSRKRHAITTLLAVRILARSILAPNVKGLPLLTWQRFEDLVPQRNALDKVCPAFCFFLSFGGSKAKHILALDSAMLALLSPRLTVCSSNFRFTHP